MSICVRLSRKLTREYIFHLREGFARWTGCGIREEHLRMNCWIHFRKSFGKCIKLNSCPLPFLPSVLCNSIWAVWSVSSFLSGEPSRLCHHFKSTIDRGVNCITLPTTMIQSTFFKPLPCNFVPASITIVMFFHYLSLELLSMFKICLSTESWR